MIKTHSPYCKQDRTGDEAPRATEQWRVIFHTRSGKDLRRENVRTDAGSRFGLSKQAVHEWASNQCASGLAPMYTLECW